MKQHVRKLLVAGSLLAVLFSGCHKPTFDEMEPSSIKWSLSVVSTAKTPEEMGAIKQLTEEVAGQRGLSAYAAFVEQEPDALVKAAEKKGLDLVIAAGGQSVADLAKEHPELRFSVLGDASEPQLANVRHLVHDRNKVLFLAGYLAAEANRTSREPFTVLVNEPRTAEDADWQMILAGMHYAGRKDLPVQVQNKDLDGSEHAGEEPKHEGVPNAARQPKPGLSGRAVLLLDMPTEKAWEKLGQKSQVIIRTDELTSDVPLQDRVGAQPASLLEPALRQESELLVSGKWTGQQKVTISTKKTYEITSPDLFPNREMGVLLELIEEQLRSGSIKPEDYIAEQRQPKRSN
jgi:hypothetical protein